MIDSGGIRPYLLVALGAAVLAGGGAAAAPNGEDLPQELCRTYERWLDKVGQPGGGGCPIQGACDIPAERDLFIPDGESETLFVRIKFNVFTEDDGSNPAASQSEVEIQIDDLNGDYLDSGIQFTPEIEFIPSTQFRFWTSSEEFEMKQTYADDPAHKLNVYLVAVDEQFSFGTFPWDSDALTAMGGIVMNEFQFGPGQTTLTHEVGHNLGLWHTHHGVSEVPQCSACYEVAGGANGDTTGDFAIDTDPTPRNFSCLPPPGDDPCNGQPWNTGSIDYQNYMGYAPTFCRNFFSEQQKGRSRCWFAAELTGWLASPPALRFAYPLGRPQFVHPGQPTKFRVQVDADLGIEPALGQAEGFVSIEGGPSVALAMSHLGSNLYEVTLPAAGQCGLALDYWFRAEATTGEPFTDPAGAPDASWRALAGFGPRVLLDDGFETALPGWTVAADPSVVSGAWERAEPVGTSTAAGPAAPDRASDLDPQNRTVYLTENGAPGGAAEASDVDGGPVDLLSPPLDLSGSDAIVSYDRWFFSDGADTLTVWVTADGLAWSLVETVDGSHNAWESAEFRVGAFVVPSAAVRVRFRTGDAPDDSITEAAIDRFRVTQIRCTACASAADCTDVLFCNGPESCDAGFCASDGGPCPGLLCDELDDVCVQCFGADDCDDGAFCNGAEQCAGDVCVPGVDPCPGAPCDDDFDVCIECVTDPECDDGVFCNGDEICFAPGVCGGGDPACPALCNESNDECVGNVLPQPRAGSPLPELTGDEVQRFELGRLAFERALDAASGLGPAYNASSCAACHRDVAAGGAGTATETRFGFDDGQGGFDALAGLGGSLLQADAASPPCAEVVPPEANVVVSRVTPACYGAGLVESVDDAAIESRALNPPGPVSGRAHAVPVLEAPGPLRVGRFGWKAQFATVRTTSTEMARDSLGLTSPLRPDDLAPNGDPLLLATCDGAADPEDQPDLGGALHTERVTDFLRFLAPPPRAPRNGMPGEIYFTLAGCQHCHTPQLTTRDDPQVEAALRGKTLSPYSDFLLHDMGQSGDPIAQGDAAVGEVRTTPLWGLRLRESLWHDGRIAGGTLEERIVAAILEHDAPGSEATPAVQSYSSLPAALRNHVVTFLASLGRPEFDQNGDASVDAADLPLILDCFTGPGSFYNASHPCSVSDVDRDGDVDDDDLALFEVVADGVAGRIPDGSGAEAPLTVDRAPGDRIALAWGPSCGAGDTDYAVYEGSLGDFTSHAARLCTTGGQLGATLTPAEGATYYLVVPTNGFKEGSYGVDGTGAERPQGAPHCHPQSVAPCAGEP